jgi:DNA polymerase-3 subunit delta
MAAPSKNSTMPFLVSFGAESYFLDRDLDRARRWPDRHSILVDGDGLTDIELVSLCEQGSIDGTLRVIVVDDAQRVKGDKALKAYIEEKSTTDSATVLAAIVRSEKLPDVWKKAADKGRLFEHKKLKTYDSNNEVVKWIETEARRIDRRLDIGISTLLFQLVGGDLHKIANELRKLCLIVPRNEKITGEHVKLVIAPAPSSDPFQVADAAIEKDAKRAMNALSILYKTQGDEVNIPVVAALIRAVERAIIARRILDKGGSDEDVATQLGIHPFIAKKFLPHVRKHPFGTLARHMGRLCRLDSDVKGAARSKRTLVELAVLSIAG